ncbi:hypothetical protein GCM10023205_04620 [Yinghuangia aomiensis]|uniref:Uncharacterized protein n=1 Tax=Yinghuangia aomiensis TaxID=676205 RepID=A0ABP9GLZ9_9ACTN
MNQPLIDSAETTAAVVEAWLITLVVNGLIQAAWKTDDDGWMIRRDYPSEPEPLPTGADALAFVAEFQHAVDRTVATRTVA